MKSSVIVFPGSNCDRDIAVALEKMHFKNKMVWHKDTSLPKSDLIVIPGGFSYGDYLRSGAIAGKSLIIDEVIKQANSGCLILGICNGFQILTETGLLKGTLLQNKNLRFINRDVNIKVVNNKTKFTNKYKKDEILKTFPTNDPKKKKTILDIIDKASKDKNDISYHAERIKKFVDPKHDKFLDFIKDNNNISIDLLDLRTLIPLDKDSILKTVKKTGKVLILQESNETGGFGSDISSFISRDLFEYLDAPVFKVASLDTPIPFADPLEANYLAKSRLSSSIKDLFSY